MTANQALKDPPTLTVVVPCFNEEDVLRHTAERLAAVLEGLQASGQITADSNVLFVDDGSRDSTWALIEALASAMPVIRGLKLARNFGHQNALLAGLIETDSDVTVSIDADLQDPPESIGEMVAAYRAGADIVCGVRADRSTDSPMKRISARAFYRLMTAMGVDLLFDHADFRLMSRPAIDSLRGYRESNLFLRGIIPQLGLRQQTVFYKREARYAGSSKYNLMRMLALCINGITSFSLMPLRFIVLLGLSVSLMAFAASVWALGSWMLGTTNVPGWTSVVIPLYFLGGIQLISLGIIGEYLGKTYLEAKRRPRFIVEKSV
jgi:glycosyltransferase involved in cell wall biosynthesis